MIGGRQSPQSRISKTAFRFPKAAMSHIPRRASCTFLSTWYPSVQLKELKVPMSNWGLLPPKRKERTHPKWDKFWRTALQRD